jgi:hypothetical protein
MKPCNHLCLRCLSFGYCRKLSCLLVSDAEIEDAEFIRDVKGFGADLDIKSDCWRNFLIDSYRDYLGRVFADRTAMERGLETFLDTQELEIDHFREWARDFFRHVPPHVKPHVRPEAWERVRVVATILRARFPEAAASWGLRASNDREAPPPRRRRRRRKGGEPLSLSRRRKKKSQQRRRPPPAGE